MGKVAIFVLCCVASTDAGKAADAFGEHYRKGGWTSTRTPTVSRSGAGSTRVATTTTCAVLEKAVLKLRSAQRGWPSIRILDAPCGDWTWMPSCLNQIITATSVQITYQGIDAVATLVQQLNSQKGDYLHGNAITTKLNANITVLPFRQVDLTNHHEMMAFRDFDIIISKHMLIHTPNNMIMHVLHNWNATKAAYLVTDNWPYTETNNNIEFVQYREMDLHKAPFKLSPPQCRSVDEGMCHEQPKYAKPPHGCRGEINVYELPIHVHSQYRPPATSRNCLTGDW